MKADGLDDLVTLVDRLTNLKFGSSPEEQHAKTTPAGLDYDRSANGLVQSATRMEPEG